MKTMELTLAESLTTQEWQLLLTCARTRIQPGASARISALAGQKIDWRKLMDAALRHGVAPQLHATLRGLNSPNVPEFVLDELGKHARRNLQRNLVMTKQLLDLVKALQANAIPVLALKGPVLAYLAYGDLGLRTFNDLDILVPEPNLPAAEQILVSQGFEVKFREENTSEGHHTGFIRADGNVWVELHWGLELMDSHHLTSLWKRAERVPIFGVPIEAFCLVDQFVFACQHGAKHRWIRLSWLSDVCAIVDRYPELDWEAVFSRAKEMNVQRSLKLALILAVQLFGIALPPEVAKKLESDLAARKMAAQVCEYILSDAVKEEQFYELWAYSIQLLDRSRDRFRLRLQYIRKSIWTGGGKRTASYFMLRVLQMAWTYARKPRIARDLFRRVFGHSAKSRKKAPSATVRPMWE